MFAIHGKVELLKRSGLAIGSYARHYYDLAALAMEADVLSMLKSSEYGAIKADYHRISSSYFNRSYFHPHNMSFANSDALFPPAELQKLISPVYESQCRTLCYGNYPSWAQVQHRFTELRPLL